MEITPCELRVLVLRGVVELAVPNRIVANLGVFTGATILESGFPVVANLVSVTKLALEMRGGSRLHTRWRLVCCDYSEGFVEVRFVVHTVEWENFDVEFIGVLFDSHVDCPIEIELSHVLIALRVMLLFGNAHTELYQLLEALFTMRFELK